jgi:hypothetical protein
VRTGLRIVLSIHAFGAFAQAMLAGEFLSGTDHAVFFHEYTAWIILGTSLCQIALAAILTKRSICPLWMLITSVFVFLAETLQAVTGYGRFLSVHVPLGVFIFGTLLVQTASAFGESE